MIYGKQFIWLHMGKTGGTTTDYLFKQVPEICTYYDFQGSHQKHDNLFECEKRLSINLSSKKKIINFRKLIPWILSHNNHQNNNFKTKEGLVFGVLAGKPGYHTPDDWIKHYITNIDIDMFIRLEHLEEDFNTFTRSLGLTRIIRAPILNSRKYNKIVFTDAEINKIYNDNPIWANIERKIYND